MAWIQGVNLSGGCTCEVPKLVRVPLWELMGTSWELHAAFEIRRSAAQESEVLGPDVLRRWSAWAPRPTEMHRDSTETPGSDPIAVL